MYFRTVATAVPSKSWSQAECWQVLHETAAVQKLSPRARKLLEKVLLGSNGIERRHFALEEVGGLPALGAQELNEAYEREAVRLGSSALSGALERAGLSGINALFVSSCTGYLCPGLSSHIAQQIGLAPDTYLADLTGAGCGASIPALRLAHGYLAAYPEHRAAVLAVEISSAAFFVDEDPGVLISLCLFGDGAAAVLLEGSTANADFAHAGRRRFTHFSGVHWPEHREKVRFVNRHGKLCNQLHRSVPDLAARAVGVLYRQRDFSSHRVLCHAGGRDVLDAIERELGSRDLTEAREVLRCFGNMSSPSVLFALERAILNERGPQPYWLCAFGAGFSAHSCALESEEPR
jgi:predicted naringenin-chalcone synthase